MSDEPRQSSDTDGAGSPAAQSLRAVHTPNFPEILRRLGCSLLVTTYQAGKLVMVRDEGDHLNTHFRSFQAPMGLALLRDRLALGTTIAGVGICGCTGGYRQARAARPPRRVLPAAVESRHGQHPDPRAGMGHGR